MAEFGFAQKVLFKHCDPAGIVFYPRYFEMMNDCVEAFFETELAFPFSELHRIGGVPTAEIHTRFQSPSRIGDHLNITLLVTRIGRTSVGLNFVAKCGDQVRFETTSTVVFVDNQGKPTPWSDAVKANLERFTKGTQT